MEYLGDTCNLVIVSDCSFNKRVRENIDTEEKMLKLQSDLQDIIDLAITIDLSETQEITIPVVFHVIVPASYTGNLYDYLPPAKINEAIQILNELYQGIRSNQPEAANCKIKFCPAMNYRLNSSTMQSLSCQHLGITYYGITYNASGVSDVNLPSQFPYFISDVEPSNYVIAYQNYFPDNQYLNFFIFGDLTDSSSVGYSGSEPFGSNINYVVLEKSIIGTNTNITRSEGYTIGHETGHYFGLDHTWGGNYSTNSCNDGDFIDDTYAHASQNLSCNELENTCPTDEFFDPVHNLMNYSPDGCRNHLTQGQAEWMHAVQQLFYSELPYTDSISEGYDIYCQTIPSIEGARIEYPVEMIRCTGVATIAIYVNDASIFSLDIVDNSTNTVIDVFDNNDFTSCGSNYCIDYNFDTAGIYRIELTVEASPTYSQTIIQNYIIQECASLTNNLDRAHWHFDHGVSLDFTSGIGQLGQTAINAIYEEVSVCSETGDLLFYTNGHDIWNRNHVLQSISLDGNLEASKGIIALDFGLNAGVHNYMMVYLDVNLNLYYRFIAIDSSYNISFTSLHQQLITNANLISNGINFANLSAMGVSACKKPDLSGYWLLSSLKDNNSSTYYPVAIEINYSSPFVGGDINISTFNTLNPPDTWPHNEFETTIKMSPNAKYLVYSVPYSDNKFYVFNAQTGIFNNQVYCIFNNFFSKFFEVAFSKDSKFMYMTEIFNPISSSDTMNMFYRIKQVDLDDIDICDCQLYGKTIFEKNSAIDLTYYQNMFFMQEGPDDRIYFSRQSGIENNAKYMGIIMYPENPATYSATDNECGTYGDFIHYPSNEWIKNDFYLPNFVDAKPDSCDLDFKVCSSNCNELSVLNLSHGYDSTFIWNFSNGINNFGYIGYTPQNIDTLAYSDFWTISLSKIGCTDTLSQEISFTGFTVNIEGSDTICNDDVLYYYSCGTGFNSISWFVNGLQYSNESELELLGSDYTSGSTVVIIANVTNQFNCYAVDTFYVYISGFNYELLSSLDCTNPVPGEVQINISGQPGITYTSTIDGFNYIVENGDNSPYYGLLPGIHSYSVSDEYCNYTGDFVTAENLLVDSVSVSTQCPGDTSDIIVWFSGGSAPYDINFSGNTFITNDTHFEITGIMHGNYGLTITDSFGCMLDTTLIINLNLPIVQIFQSGENYCSNDNNVSLVAVVNGGTPAYQFQWGEYENPLSFFGTGNFLENIISFPEAIFITVTDANGCSAIDSLQIPSVVPPLLLDIEATNPCGNQNNGSMDLTITGSNQVTELYWLVPNGNNAVDTIFNQQDLQNLSNHGIYRVRVWDEFGCLYYSLHSLSTFDEPFVQQPLCYWDFGSITTNWDFPETLGENSYSSSNWLINEFGDSIPENVGCFDLLPGGTYILHHADEQGCILTETIEIYDPQPLQYDVDAEYYSDSEGNAMFTSIVTVTGEYAPYTYFPNTGYPTIINCTDVDVQVISNAAGQPAEFQLTGAISDCNLNNAPYFRLCSYSTGFLQIECDCIDIYFLEGIEDIHDTIHLDTIIKPTKCLAAGYGTGSVDIFDISTDMNIFPVFFLNTSTNDTLVLNGDPAEIINFEDFGTGTFTIEYWNAFSEVNTITVTIDDVFDQIISGIITTGNYVFYENQTIAVDGIEVQALASLTFKNCTVYTAIDTYSIIDETKWFVNRKGKLVLDQSTVESGCPEKWKGIEVDGIGNYTQNLVTAIGIGTYYSQQGYFIMSGNSSISDAYTAVNLKGGSVGNITNSHFYNNQYSVYFNPYSAPTPVGSPIPANKSLIRNNEFIIDSLLHPTGLTGTDRYQSSQVYVTGAVSAVSLLGNRFYYSDNNVHPSVRGNGIYATNSSISVKPYSSYSSILNGFNTGFKSQIGVASRKVSITYSSLNNNVYAIDIRNHIAPIVENNTIDSKNLYVCPPGYFCAIPIPCAIYLEACDQYSIKLNNVKNGYYGAYIRNSGENYNLLYKNDFDSVAYPAIANLRNSDFVQGVEPGNIGLEMKCNDFNHFGYAISVTGNMQRYQGSATGGSSTLAGNRFDISTSTHPEREFIVSTTDPTLNIAWYDYYHHLTPICIPDLRTTNKVTLHNPGNYQYSDEDCPDNPGTIMIVTKSTDNSLFDIYTEFDDSISFAISQKQTELNQMIDNGNTLLLRAKAASMSSSNYYEVLQSLDLDGMLSDEVILELMQNTIAPQVAKVQALINNSPLPEEAKKKIDDMSDVDENLREILLDYQNGKNAREIKEAEISELKSDKAKNISDLVKYVAMEDDSELNSMIITFLVNQNTISQNKTALQFAVSQRDYNTAGEIINSIAVLSQNLPIYKQVEIQNYNRLQNIAIGCEQNFNQSDSIIYANSEFLFTLANDTLLPECAQAQVLLENAGLAEYPPVVYPPVVDNQKYIFFDNSQSSQNKQNDFVKVYPNPSKDNLFVEYIIFDYDEKLQYRIEIMSQTGQLLETKEIDNQFGLLTINIRNFTPGNYLLKFNNTVIKFTKM